MANGGIEVARAYVTIIPSMEGSQKAISKDLGAAVSTEGTKAGKTLGEKIVGGLGNAGKKIGATTAMVTGAAASAIEAATVAITKKAVQSFADYEQLAGGVEKIFSNMNTSVIMQDAQNAYKNLNMSANEYLESINNVGAMFKSTMGDQAAYETAKKGMQALSDYATGTGKDISLLNEKYAMITRSTSSYQSIADQFAGILPATSQSFLEQAQAAGLLEGSYKSLTEVPIDEYQQAVTAMMEKGTASLGLAGNTAHEALSTISGSILATKSSWSNFITALAGGGDIAQAMSNLKESIFGVEGASNGLINNIVPKVTEVFTYINSALPSLVQSLIPSLLKTIASLLPSLINGVINLVRTMVVGLADFIKSDGFTQLLDSIVASIPLLVTTIIELLPTIIEAVTLLIVKLSIAIVKALPDIFVAIINALPSLITGLFDASYELFTVFFTEGIPALLSLVARLIIEGIPALINAVAKILDSITTKLIELPKTIMNGIRNLFSSITDTSSTWSTDLLVGLANFGLEMLNAIINLGAEVLKFWTLGLVDLTRENGDFRDSIKNTIVNIYNGITSTINNIINGIGNFVNRAINIFNSFRSTVANIFDNVRAAIANPIITAQNIISNAINAIQNIIHGADFQLPHIQLPHFNISGSFSISPRKVPSISVDWYGKGYDEAQILQNSTIFGIGANGSLLGGGEKPGNEVVVGEEHLISLIKDNVGTTKNITLNVYPSPSMDEETFVDLIMDKLQSATDDKEAVYA